MIITSRNNAPISNYGVVSDVKFSKKSRKKKMTEKREYFTQNQFSTKSIYLYGCNSKTDHCKYLKFSPNFYVIVIYIRLNFQKILTFFEPIYAIYRPIYSNGVFYRNFDAKLSITQIF
ncbi:hypothetical protein FWK35_00023617 [Aphis craccivora]|uniref:Uncharacterized protein n=1 Tax=Aphis craccivora TaxID=307492 RepID=A0A6G0YM96_APHCR|nr:hypothetical protein FWK35_00023617 [Aphis craccivora]